MNENIECLKVVKDILQKNGWTKGALLDTEGRHCLVGALYYCGKSHSVLGQAMRLLAHDPLVIDRGGYLVGSIGDVVNFNNHNKTTLEDVFTVIDRTIERAQQEAQAV